MIGWSGAGQLVLTWRDLFIHSLELQVKGMGEKQIEVDRRLLKGRMARLRRDIEEVGGPSRCLLRAFVLRHSGLTGWLSSFNSFH